MENHAKYGDTIYFHDDSSLYVNLFIASELSWPEKNLVLKQETKFPENDAVWLTVKAKKPVKLALKVRWPAWAQTMPVMVNGKWQKISGQPASYVTIDREWRDGDSVEIQVPMKLHAEPLPGATNIVALLYGPIVLAGELGTNDLPNPYVKNQTEYAHRPTPPAPVFAASADTLLKHVKEAAQPLTFHTENVGKPADVWLIPLYRVNKERYSVYWNLTGEPAK